MIVMANGMADAAGRQNRRREPIGAKLPSLPYPIDCERLNRELRVIVVPDSREF
jgi:hypothetical protein